MVAMNTMISPVRLYPSAGVVAPTRSTAIDAFGRRDDLSAYFTDGSVQFSLRLLHACPGHEVSSRMSTSPMTSCCD